MTKPFLAFTKECGNDLSTPMEEYKFEGLVEGDHWCLSLWRWLEAARANMAPLVILESCHESVLNFVSLPMLQKYAYNNDEKKSDEEKKKDEDQKEIYKNFEPIPKMPPFSSIPGFKRQTENLKTEL